MRLPLLFAVLTGLAFGQTIQPPSTSPVYSPWVGPALPGICIVGQVFFLTTATPGMNIYGCTVTGAPGTWTLQSGGSGGGGGGVGATAWGSIPGTLSAQADLWAVLGLKAPLLSPVFTGQPTIPDFTLAGHSHQNLSGGGTLDAAAIATGILAIGRIPTGATSTTVAIGNHNHDTAYLGINATAVAATAAANLAGGAAGQYPVQSGAGATIFRTPNVANGPITLDGSGNSSISGTQTATAFLPSGTSASALAALPIGAHGFACDESSTAGVPATGVDYIRCKAGVGLVQSINGGAETPIGSGGGSMVYPAAGIPQSTGTAWGSSLTLDTDATMAANSDTRIASQKATATALAAKQGTLTLTTTGTAGAATLSGNVLNIPQYTGGGGTGNPYSASFTCSSTPTSFLQSTHLQGSYPYIRFTDSSNFQVAPGAMTLASNGDITVSCGVSATLKIFISGAVGAHPTIPKTFTSASSVVIYGINHGFGSPYLKAQTWDNATPRNWIQPGTVAVDATTFNATVTFSSAISGLAVLAAN